MTVRQIAARLEDCGIEGAMTEALLLAERYTGIRRSALLSDPNMDVRCDGLEEAVSRRCTRYPLQYILGTWGFMGMTLVVREGCLIPRPDTEILVEEALRHLPEGGRFLDLCTGSGCIPAALLQYGKNTSGIAMDLYPDALAVARENMASLGFADRVDCILGDVREDIFPFAEGISFDVITANPPYIAVEEMKTLETELSAEPVSALTDGGDGLSLYRAILQNYGRYLKPEGVFVLEHGYTQADAVLCIGKEFGYAGRTLYDYGKNPRCAVLWKNI